MRETLFQMISKRLKVGCAAGLAVGDECARGRFNEFALP